MLVCATISAQDTLCVMVTLDEVIHFNWYTSDVIYRYDHTGSVNLQVEKGETMCINLYDNKKRYRDIYCEFDDGDHNHATFNSKDNLITSKNEWGSFTIEISEPRKRK